MKQPVTIVDLDKTYAQGVKHYCARRFDEAEACFQEVLSLSPTAVPALVNLGNCAEATGRYALAVACYERALSLQPLLVEAYNNIAAAQHKMDNIGTALATVEKALSLSPFNKNIRWNRSVFNLSLGNLVEGWEDYDARFWRPDARDKLRAQPPPYWEGQPLGQGVRVRVWAEQGLGEVILYASMLKDFVRFTRGSKIVLDVPKALVAAMTRSFPDIEVVEEGSTAPAPCHYQLPLGSLGKMLRRSFSDFRSRKPYLLAPKNAAPDYRALHPGKLIVGLSWKSSNDVFGQGKSMDLIDLSPVLSVPGIVFVDLQYGDTQAEIDDVRSGNPGFKIISKSETFYRTADLDPWLAMVKACDVVLTVSNLTAHAAGAMGVKTIVMLPRGLPCLWHWFRLRSDSPFYGSVTLVRQQKPPHHLHKWHGDVIPLITETMTELVANPPLRESEEYANSLLIEELNVLAAGKNPDTPENFAKTYAEFQPRMLAAAAPFARNISGTIGGHTKPVVAFYLPNAVMLAHTVNLLTFMRAYHERPEDQREFVAIVVVPRISDQKFREAFAPFIVRECPGETPFHHWRSVQSACDAAVVSAFVHVSNIAGMAFASTIRCAPKHIWLSMKWHGVTLPGIDGYLDATNQAPAGSRKMLGGNEWVCTHTAFPEVFHPGYGLNTIRLHPGFTFGSMGREEKLTPEYAEAVATILKRIPDSAFLYAGRQKPQWFEDAIVKTGVSPERVRHIGWCEPHQTVERINSFDVFLDTFPFQCGHTAIEAMALGKPVVWLASPYDGDQSITGTFAAMGGDTPQVTKTVDEYVARAILFASSMAMSISEGEMNRLFYRERLRNTELTASSVETAIMEVIRQ